LACRAPTNLPLEITSFVGRGRESAEVQRLLRTTRLLTLTGAGGCGKTRLALHVAADMLDGYPDGVWLVELATITDQSLVAQTVAATLGVRERPGAAPIDTLVDALRTEALLIVLDNCEHVLDAAAALAESLLRTCPGVRILATSREALGSAGEVTWRVPSLAVPPLPGGGLDLDRFTAYEAVRLFIDRARAMQQGFRVNEANARAIGEICRRLDGIPLAIELAAARVSIFSVDQIAARLDDRFRLLSAGRRTALPRQQTLRATVDWSFALLSEPERTLLRRLSVFAGGWTFDAAEAVIAGDGIQTYAVLDLLAQLVGKSLVLAEEQRGAVRYRLLETIRQYAADKLQEAGEMERTRERHLRYFLGLAEEGERMMRGREQAAWLDRLEAEHDNTRAALEWALAGSGEEALRVSGALTWFWWLRGHQDEGRRWLARVLERAQAPSPARMKALHGAGWLAQHQRDLADAHDLLTESLAIARALGEECLTVAEQVGDRWLMAWALHLLGLAAQIAADYPTARAYYAQSLAIRHELGYEEGIAILRALLGIIELREGNLVEAHVLFRQNLETMHELTGGALSNITLATFAGLAAVQGQYVRAVRLAGAIARLSEVIHLPPVPAIGSLLIEQLARAREALGEAAYAAAWAEGRAMSVEESVAEALAIEPRPEAPTPAQPVPVQPADAPPANLTPAELQVLRLVAGGCTTREIADTLVVATSTVDRHLTHIYQKLGVRNRAAATAFALQHGLA
jgi:non-specific serine/threonine protein kinase